MKVLYTGFKGVHNSSYKLVNAIDGERLFLTNSFRGLERDIVNICQKYDAVCMFGLDKNLKNSIRIEKCAEKDGKLLWTTLNVEKLSKKVIQKNIEYLLTDKPTQYLCNEAYFCMLEKVKGNAIFIHIPSVNNMTDELMNKIIEVMHEFNNNC